MLGLRFPSSTPHGNVTTPVEVFEQTRVTVNQLTQGALLPWSASKLTKRQCQRNLRFSASGTACLNLCVV